MPKVTVNEAFIKGFNRALEEERNRVEREIIRLYAKKSEVKLVDVLIAIREPKF